jgi:hypothetical protein
MNPQQPVRPKSSLHESLNHRLGLYALAAGAASLAAPAPTEAEVVYTPAHQAIEAGGFYVLDLNHDGVADFRFGNVGRASFGVFYVEPWGASGSFNGEQVEATGPPYPLALRPGAPIGPGKLFYGSDGGSSYNQILAGNNQGAIFGNWVDVSNRCVGLRFRINGENHYGWARLSVQVNGTAVSALLNGYAYETVANQGLRAGQTSETATYPETTGLATGDQADNHAEQPVLSLTRSLGWLARGAALRP